MNKLKLSNDDIRKELEDPTLTDKQRSIILDYLLYKERQKERALKAVEARQAKYTNEQWKKLMSDRAKKVWKKRKLLKK